METMLGNSDANEGEDVPTERHQFNDVEVASVLVTFLFASQDASTSSLVWVMELLAANPNVLQKIRQELHTLLNIPMPNKETSTGSNSDNHLKDINFTPEILAKAEYTRQTVLEVLRFRPPATMVPYEAVKEHPLDKQQYTVPKGTLVLPSIWCSRLDEGFKEAEKFVPERFSAENNEHVKNAKNYLAFGYGTHRCIGKEYALNHLILFTCFMAMCTQWERNYTDQSEKIIFGPTIFPADGCLVNLKARAF